MAKKPEKAYKNLDFLNSSEARILRILAEYLEPRVRFHKQGVENTIVFFGSARTLSRDEAQAGVDAARKNHESDGTADSEKTLRISKKKLEAAEYYEDARELARQLTTWSNEQTDPSRQFYITSGGGPGIMEAANRGASEAPDGRSIGLNISIPTEQDCNPYIDDDLNFEFHYFFTRKFWFIYLAKAIVVFPGGFGTLDELFEVLTLIQTGKSGKKMPVVLYGENYWRELINFDALVENLVISERDLDLLTFCNSVEDAFALLTKHMNNHRA